MTSNLVRARTPARVVGLVLSIGLVPLLLGVTTLERQSRGQADAALDRALSNEAQAQATALDSYFARARSMILLAAQESAFRRFSELPGERLAKLKAGGPVVEKANHALAYLEELYPGAIGETCFIDRSGAEVARVVRGRRAAIDELSLEEAKAPFFAPTFTLRPGQVFQAEPYESPDTGEWVVSNSTPIPSADGSTRAILHFEVTIESFRRASAVNGDRFSVAVVNARSGAVAFDSDTPQRRGQPLGGLARPRVVDFDTGGRASGRVEFGGGRRVFRRLRSTPGNANDWYVVVSTQSSTSRGLAGSVVVFCLVTIALLLAIGLALSHRWKRTTQLALTDELTGLANRRAFAACAREVLGSAAQQEAAAAFLVMDLDRFKEFNDSLGHQAGDALLREVADRLRQALPECAVLARLGGDEFAAVLGPGADLHAARRAVNAVAARLEEPFTLEGLVMHVDASVGIAICPEHGTELDVLLRHADAAMYAAKRNHTGSEVYAAEAESEGQRRLALLPALRGAFERDELVLHFQPQADLATGTVTGVEALVRWQHPTHGLLGPGEFVALAEETGLARRLTLNVLDLALRQCREWEQVGLNLRIAVNLAGPNLLDIRFPDDLAGLIAKWGVSPELLQLEITENTVMLNPDRSLDILARLSELGVGLSLDDYGTGFSSLAYLRRLPVQELKVDRSFVMGMSTDHENAVIVQSTVDLAQNLGLRVVAEGVESAEVWALLRSYGCHQGQGYHLSRPVPAADLEAWLQARPGTSLPSTTPAAAR